MPPVKSKMPEGSVPIPDMFPAEVFRVQAGLRSRAAGKKVETGAPI